MLIATATVDVVVLVDVAGPVNEMVSMKNSGTVAVVGIWSQKPSSGTPAVKPSEAREIDSWRHALVGKGARRTGVWPALLIVPWTWTTCPPALPPLTQNVRPVKTAGSIGVVDSR